jgi:hypothetical protein
MAPEGEAFPTIFLPPFPPHACARHTRTQNARIENDILIYQICKIIAPKIYITLSASFGIRKPTRQGRGRDVRQPRRGEHVEFRKSSLAC